MVYAFRIISDDDAYDREIFRAHGILLDAIKREAQEGRGFDGFILLDGILMTYRTVLQQVFNEPSFTREELEGVLASFEKRFESVMKDTRRRFGY